MFLDRVELCHKIDLLPRLGIPGATLPPADLLLMKLQVVETNDKDFRDMAALLVDQPLADHDDDAINVDYLCGLAARDWGLWRTMTMVARRLDAHAPTLGDERDRRARSARRWRSLLERAGVRARSRAAGACARASAIACDGMSYRTTMASQ